VSSTDPLGDPTSATPIVRRRDLREPSTRSSRKDARKRAEARRTSPTTRPSGRRSSVIVARKPPLKRRVGTKLFAIVSLSFVVLLVIATSIPQSVFGNAPASATSASSTSASAKVHTVTVGQSYKSSGVATDGVSREGFKATSEDVLAQVNAVAADAGYTVNNSGPIRWPFDLPVPLGDLFGPRVAPCSGCSTFHNGTDFETGDKAPVYAVAAGTVTVSDMDGSLGQNIAISHNVKGLVFTSVYGHLTAGSAKVSVGDKVTEGELIGLTGSTGESTGPHLFLEIDINGSPVDSLAWLKAHTAH
jgi:murein DD-endopeptidase MepM/ murein hydrolase activator NlpD